jgi:spore germination protein YaaH
MYNGPVQKFLAIAVGALGCLVGILWAISHHTPGSNIVWPVARSWWGEPRVLGDTTYVAAGEAVPKLGIVYGFLPYWNVSGYRVHEAVTHLSYFRLAVNGKGEFMTQAGDGGYQIYSSAQMQTVREQAGRSNIKFEVTIFSSQSDEIYKLIRCVTCQDKLITNIKELMTSDRLDGINLDLEYLGYVSAEERDLFTKFVFRLREMMTDNFPRAQLSIDVYGGAAWLENNLWDLRQIAKIVNRVIVMGYDYKTRSASAPGPSAPVLGGEVYGGDIWADVRGLMKYVPREKIVLAVPFYGYAWETTSGDIRTAKTYPGTGQTMMYRGAQKILADKSLGAQEYWDDQSLTPYLVYQEEGKWKIGFFENERSLRYKMDLIGKLGLGGMAIWALGYEGEYQELWDTISERF